VAAANLMWDLVDKRWEMDDGQALWMGEGEGKEIFIRGKLKPKPLPPPTATATDSTTTTSLLPSISASSSPAATVLDSAPGISSFPQIQSSSSSVPSSKTDGPHKSISTKTVTASSVKSSASHKPKTTAQPQNGLSGGAIGGIAFASVIAALLLGGIVFFFIKRRRRQYRRAGEDDYLANTTVVQSSAERRNLFAPSSPVGESDSGGGLVAASSLNSSGYGYYGSEMTQENIQNQMVHVQESRPVAGPSTHHMHAQPYGGYDDTNSDLPYLQREG